jgi:hypothetical protein
MAIAGEALFSDYQMYGNMGMGMGIYRHVSTTKRSMQCNAQFKAPL